MTLEKCAYFHHADIGSNHWKSLSHREVSCTNIDVYYIGSNIRDAVFPMICYTNIGNFSMRLKISTIPILGISFHFPLYFLLKECCWNLLLRKTVTYFVFLLCKNKEKLQLYYLENFCTLPNVDVPHMFLSFLLSHIYQLFSCFAT